MKKKLFTILLLSALVLTGCGGKETPASAEPTESEGAVETAGEEMPEAIEDEEEPDEVVTDTSLSETSSDSSEESEEAEETNLVEPQYEDGSPEKDIQDYAVNTVMENYIDTDIESISVNENLGTDEPGDYVLLVRLIWNQKNSGSTSKDILSLYSEDFAARIGMDQSVVNEIAIFWTVPYLDNANAKWAYERNGEGMYQTDTMMSAVFNQ